MKKQRTFNQLLAARDRSKTTRTRILVHEWEYKVCPQCKGSKTQKMSTLFHPADGVQDYETTCQFCGGQGESGFVREMVEVRKTAAGNYVRIKGKAKKK